MKIIDNPSSKPWAMKSTCIECKTTVELGVDDLARSRQVYDQRDGNAAVYRCPTCNRECWINMSVIPAHLRHFVR